MAAKSRQRAYTMSGVTEREEGVGDARRSADVTIAGPIPGEVMLDRNRELRTDAMRDRLRLVDVGWVVVAAQDRLRDVRGRAESMQAVD